MRFAVFWTREKGWLKPAGMALVFLFLAAPLAQTARRHLEPETQKQRVQKDALAARLAQEQADAQAARELADAFQGEDIERYLAPLDRAALAAQLEPLARKAGLSHFLFTLEAATPWPEAQDLTQSRLTVEGEAALDTDLFNFLRELSALQGRLDIESLALKRQSEAPLAPLRFEASLLWIGPAEEKAP